MSPADDEFDETEPSPPGTAQSTLDPAEIAADLMIDRMLSLPGLREAVAAPGTAVVVLVPGKEWLDTVSDSWRDTVRGGVESKTANTHRPDDPGVDWREFNRSERAKPEHDAKADEEIAQARWKGVAIVGFAHDSRHLPPSLVKVADHTLALGPVDSAVVNEVIRRLTGSVPGIQLDDATCAAITPAVLRLARNPGQSPDDYLRGLIDLVAHAGAPAQQMTGLDRLHGMPAAVAWGLAGVTGKPEHGRRDRGARRIVQLSARN